jgi:hypothetical protein
MIAEPEDCWKTGSHCGIGWVVRFLLVSALLGSWLPLQAATYWWASKSGSGNQNWALANNWLNNTSPVSNAGNNLVFDTAFLRSGGTTTTVDNSPNWIFNTLTLAQSAFSVEVQQSLTINTLTSANISPTTAIANTINGNISVTGAGNLLFTAGNGTSTPSAALNGTISTNGANASATLGGVWNVGSAGKLTNTSGTFTLNGITLNGTTDANTLTGAGFSLTGANILNQVSNTAALTIRNGTTTLTGTHTNSGGLSVTGGTLRVNGSTPGPGGILNGGSVTVSGTGTLDLQAGSTMNASSLSQTGGTTHFNSAIGAATVNFSGGSVDGTEPGFAAGSSVTNSGVNLNPGGNAVVPSGTPVTWSFTNYTQNANGTLTLDVFGVSTYDRLVLAGRAVLGGALNIVWDNGVFSAPLATRLHLIAAAGGVSGTFSSVALNLNNPNNVPNWFLAYTANGVDLVFDVPEPPTLAILGGALLALGLVRRRR